MIAVLALTLVTIMGVTAVAFLTLAIYGLAPPDAEGWDTRASLHGVLFLVCAALDLTVTLAGLWALVAPWTITALLQLAGLVVARRLADTAQPS